MKHALGKRRIGDDAAERAQLLAQEPVVSPHPHPHRHRRFVTVSHLMNKTGVQHARF
jgi:hypothetical protein